VHGMDIEHSRHPL